MKQHFEKEYKNIITKDRYHHLKETFFKDSLLISQTNFYLDTAAFCLRKQQMMARIRRYAGYEEFTLKVPVSDQCQKELSFKDQKIASDDARITKILASFKITQTVNIVTFSKTFRNIKEDAWGQWALDHSFFEKGQDYELEYELFDATIDRYSVFLDFLNKHQIPLHKSLSKVQRAFQLLAKKHLKP